MRLRRRPTPSVVLLCVLLGLIALRFFSGGGSPFGDVVGGDHLYVVQRVVDGDTLLLAEGHRVRLIGVDTPETKDPNKPVERLGPEASEFTRSLVEGRPIRLEFDRQRRDRYQRLLAYVYRADGRMLNEELIRAGFSRAETRFPYRSDMKLRFVAAEAEARAAQRGMWAPSTASPR